MTSETVPAPGGAHAYVPDQIVIYGVCINEGGSGQIQFSSYTLNLDIVHNDADLGAEVQMGADEVAVAVVYGYAYEGQCYRLDRPKLMIFEYGGGPADADGCGFSDLGYKMWFISAKQKMLELNTNVDLAEVLILEANLPGNRTPNTYGNSMKLAHRGGRISPSGGGGL